ncbi:MAG: peptide ABC transporter substrate-binding protein [Thermomicrobiales bacterium]|nr:peptide ABC transporter substrate-binding protein [Thermomicrobiales bacterium]
MTEPRHEGMLTARERAEAGRLWEALRRSSPAATRRELLRWSAIAAGAVATARFGIAEHSAAAAPALQDAAVVQGAEIVVPFDSFGQSVTLDPHRSSDYGGFWVMYPNVWAGLLGYDENGRVVRDLASDAVVSQDGLTYTFTIRDDAAYTSGNPVVAADFVASWTRALDPANISPMASFMQHVVGFADYTGGDTSAALGFAAPDDRTVVVTLSEAVNFFPSYMASFVWAVVDPAILEAAGDQNFVLNGAGAGPWQFTAYELDVQFEMTPNPNYYGGPNPSLTKITWPILSGPDAAREALDRYRNDEVISADVPLSLKTEVDADSTLAAELIVLDQAPGSIRSLAMDFLQPPFDDVRVRRAFALAFDRDRYAEIYENTWVPTSVFTPPVVTEIAGYTPPPGLSGSLDEAAQLLTDAGYANPDDMPDVTFYLPAEESDAERDRVKAVLGMLGENLGVTLLFDGSKTQAEIDQIRADAGGNQFDIIWWQNVADTPHLLSEVFRPDSPYMQGVFNWSPDLEASGDFDPGTDAQTFAGLMDQADVEPDPDARNDLYQQGEELVLNNAVYIPIANWTPMFVQKPALQGTRQGSWTGRLPILFDSAVVVVQQ